MTSKQKKVGCVFCGKNFEASEIITVANASICFPCLSIMADLEKSLGLREAEADHSELEQKETAVKKENIFDEAKAVLEGHRKAVSSPAIPYPCYVVMEKTLNFGIDMQYSDFTGVVNRENEMEFYKSIEVFIHNAPAELLLELDKKSEALGLNKLEHYEKYNHVEDEDRIELLKLFKGTDYRLVGYDYGNKAIRIELTREAANDFIEKYPLSRAELSCYKSDSMLGLSVGFVKLKINLYRYYRYGIGR